MITTAEPHLEIGIAKTIPPPAAKTTSTERTPGPIDNMREQIRDEMEGKVVSNLKTPAAFTTTIKTTARPKTFPDAFGNPTSDKNKKFKSKFSDFSPPPRRKRGDICTTSA